MSTFRASIKMACFDNEVSEHDIEINADADADNPQEALDKALSRLYKAIRDSGGMAPMGKYSSGV
jgi:ribosome-associated translation inhibitor RaiA